MEVYAYEGGRISLQISGNRGEDIGSLSRSSDSQEVSFYSPRLRELFSKESPGPLFELKKADGYMNKLKTILTKLQKNNASSPDIGEKILHLGNGLRALLKKFPMLSAVTTKLANWDIKTLIGREPVANHLLKEMKEAITSVQDELDQIAKKAISKTTKTSLQNKEEFLASISLLNDSEIRSSHSKLSTNRVIDLI